MRDEIALIHSPEIDRSKWDACISSASNSLIYATSSWLDHLADNWSGLILNDYEAVMPVTWRKKYGIRYCYHVPFVQQLGIYGLRANTDGARFAKALLPFCRYGTYPFNYANSGMGDVPRTNFVLPLDRSYGEISVAFSGDVLQNIRRAENNGLHYEKATRQEGIEAYRDLYSDRIMVSDDTFSRMGKLCEFLSEGGNLIGRKAISANGEVLAIALLPSYGGRLYNIMNSTFPAGKKLEANYFLLSQLWKEHQLSGMVFDFEGSDIPGVKAFYRKFGATDQPYFHWRFNHLPWPLKMFK